MSWLRDKDRPSPTGLRKVPEAAPGWRVTPFDDSGSVWLHEPEPDEVVKDDENKEAAA